jgi:hypothetical protein
VNAQSLHPYSDILSGARQVLDANWREGRNECGVPFGYTCPDAHKYPDQFFWDSCFHALSWSRFDPSRAMRELRSLAAAQLPSGMIGHTKFWYGPCRPSRAFTYNLLQTDSLETSTIQPPLLAWVWAEVAERAGDAQFAEEGRDVLTRFHAFLDRSRTAPDGLIGILQPDETGLDATPAYDLPLGWRSHPKLGFLALQHFNRSRKFDYRRVVADGGFHATDVLVNTAWILGWEGLARLGVAAADRRAEELTAALVARLYDEKRGLFFAEGPSGERLNVSTWAGLAPLALPHLPVDICSRIVDEHLLSPEHFWLPCPIPSTAASEASFIPGEDRYLWIERYWRGPTWPFTPWFILRGLLRLERDAEAAHLVDRTTALVRQSGFREYFNPMTGQGFGAKRFGVSSIAVEIVEMAREAFAGRRAIA